MSQWRKSEVLTTTSLNIRRRQPLLLKSLIFAEDGRPAVMMFNCPTRPNTSWSRWKVEEERAESGGGGGMVPSRTRVPSDHVSFFSKTSG